MINDSEEIKMREPKWITKEIKEEIKHRKDLNRKKRNVNDVQRHRELVSKTKNESSAID